MRDRDDVLKDLDQPLDEARIRGVNVGGGASAPYLAAFDIIKAANRIFGHDGWSYRIIGAPTFMDGAGLYMAEVEVTILGVTRSDIGTNTLSAGERGPQPSHHEMSIKGAVSDALKRALRSFGAQFGNDLYDKDEYPTLRAGEERQQAGGQRSEPNPPQARTTQARPVQGEQAEGGFRNAGDFFSWAWTEHKLGRDVVLKLLDMKPTDIAGDDQLDWALLKTRLNVRLAEIEARKPAGAR